MQTKQSIEREIADLEVDIMQLEEFIAEEQEDLERLTADDYQAEDNPDHEFRGQDIEECQDAIAGYQREIARFRRKIERLKERLTASVSGNLDNS